MAPADRLVERLRTAVDLWATGVALKRETIRRHHPDGFGRRYRNPAEPLARRSVPAPKLATDRVESGRDGVAAARRGCCRSFSGSAEALDELRQPWALVGGLAVSVRSEPRFTRDIDVAAAVIDDAGAEALVSSLVASGFRLRLSLEHETLKRLATVRLSPPGEPEEGVVVDLLFASSGIESEICREADRLELGPGLTVPVAQAGHLVAMKLLALAPDRPQDAHRSARTCRDPDRDRSRAGACGGGAHRGTGRQPVEAAPRGTRTLVRVDGLVSRLEYVLRHTTLNGLQPERTPVQRATARWRCRRPAEASRCCPRRTSISSGAISPRIWVTSGIARGAGARRSASGSTATAPMHRCAPGLALKCPVADESSISAAQESRLFRNKLCRDGRRPATSGAQ